jgi:HNH endonuclease
VPALASPHSKAGGIGADGLSFRERGAPRWRHEVQPESGYIWLRASIPVASAQAARGQGVIGVGTYLVDGKLYGRCQIKEHILVMEEALGRPLLSFETVHHKNGVNGDNRFDNLELRHGQHGSGQAVSDLHAEIARLRAEVSRLEGERCACTR